MVNQTSISMPEVGRGSLTEHFDAESFLTHGAVQRIGDGQFAVGWGAPIRTEEPRDNAVCVFAPDFLLDEPRPWFVFPHGCLISEEDFRQELRLVAGEASPWQWHEQSQEPFEKEFEEVLRRIRVGELEKAVPVSVRYGTAQINPAQLAARLLIALKHTEGTPLTLYGVWTPELGLLGTTPETLFEIDTQGSLRTMAIAGTRDRNGAALLSDPKEVHEHRVVVRGLIDRLSPIGHIRVGETKEIELPTLVHLATPIYSDNEAGLEFEELVRLLHPTPAIGAWPRIFGEDWIRHSEGSVARKRHGAPFAVCMPGQKATRCLVAIRNVQWDGSSALLVAGCGVVSESVFAHEWAEVQAKQRAVQSALLV